MSMVIKYLLILIIMYIIVVAPFAGKEKAGVLKKDAFTYPKMI